MPLFTDTKPPGFGSVAGTPAANASGDRLQEEFERLYGNDGTLDERTKNQSTAGTKTDFEGEITGTIASVATANVATVNVASVVNHGGTPVAGYDSATSDPIRKKIIDIGDWDMAADKVKNVAHGLSDDKIRSVYAMIRNDIETALYPLQQPDFGTSDLTEGGITAVQSGNVSLFNRPGGFFNNSSFNAITFNRGWLTIEYVD